MYADVCTHQRGHAYISFFSFVATKDKIIKVIKLFLEEKKTRSNVAPALRVSQPPGSQMFPF